MVCIEQRAMKQVILYFWSVVYKHLRREKQLTFENLHRIQKVLRTFINMKHVFHKHFTTIIV